MRLRRLLLVPTVLLAMFGLTGCLDEIGELLEIIAYEESDDPSLQELGRVLAEDRKHRLANEAIDNFLRTGDRSELDRARELLPDDTGIRGYDVALATLGGDPAEIEAAQRALAIAESRRLASIDDPDNILGPVTAEKLERNVLGEILVAQTNMLGGSLNDDWDPPGPGASQEQQRLYADYCQTRSKIMAPPHSDSLSYITLPPCP